MDAAIAKLDSSKVDVRIEWSPFQLDSTSPQEQVTSKRMAYDRKFGLERMRPMIANLTKRAQHEGIEFSYDKFWSGDSVIGNTFQSHRLLEWAKTQGPRGQHEMAEVLFKAYFSREDNIFTKSDLARIVSEDGQFDRQQVTDFLNGNQLQDEVVAGLALPRELGVSGVPYFLFDEKLAVSGGQPQEQFLAIFEELGATSTK